MKCWKCGQSGATIPDPCCGAPDCENLTDYVHYECLSRARQIEEDRWREEDIEFDLNEF